MSSYNVTRGAAFGPVKFTVANRDRSPVSLSSAIVRLSKDGVGVRDSTVAKGEIVVNDTADTVTWNLPMEATATLTEKAYDYELIVVDQTGQQRIPREDGRGRIVVESRASAPA